YRTVTGVQTCALPISRSSFLEKKAQALETYDQTDLNNKVNVSLVAYPTDKDFANVIGIMQNLTAQSGFAITNLSLGAGSVKKSRSEERRVGKECRYRL